MKKTTKKSGVKVSLKKPGPSASIAELKAYIKRYRAEKRKKEQAAKQEAKRKALYKQVKSMK